MWRRACAQFARIADFDRNLGLGLGLGLGFRSRWYSSGQSGKRFAALWGNGDYGRLGLGSVNSQWRPVICSAFNGDSVRSIACGGAHTLFLTESGRVYASGLNDFGQLGISDDKSYTMRRSAGNSICDSSGGFPRPGTDDKVSAKWRSNAIGRTLSSSDRCYLSSSCKVKS
ncbi:hypothetical protein Cgig2_024933 [Carnegiea gigantea]|uniref:Uncharacterized protein n=1 Tax=Carnegiea gigantea TaxID=171969 RepID=A0A9Q1KE16_9CARY|nr:hypothetical protein Cgig2_024933 [Carnegiea gigantea]